MKKCLTGLTVLMLLMSTGLYAATVTVNAGTTYQSIRGFGGSNAWSDCASCNGSAQNSWLVSNADKLFTTTSGIGLSIIRMRIPPDSSQFGSAIAPVQAARDRGAMVMATEWTPPPQWKSANTTSNSNGEYLLPSNYQNYANYLRDFVKTMKTTYNVDIYALCGSNEPDYRVSYDGCSWSGAQELDFIKNYLGPTFTTAGLTTKIIVGESYANNFSITDPTLNDATAANYVSVAAVHTYGGGPTAYPLAASKGKEYWMTEMSSFEAYDGSIGNGMKVAGWIHNSLVNANMNAYIYWWLASDQNNEGITSVTKGDAKRFYVMGNYSKFIRPGYIRIASTASPATGVTSSAYKSSDNSKFVIVATNTGSSASSLTFNLTGITAASFIPYVTSSSLNLAAQTAVTVSGNSFTYSLPAQSVVSFVGGGSVVTPTNTPFAGTPTNTPVNTATPVSILLDDMEDGNNTNNWSGNWYSYSGTGTTITPKPFAMTAGGMTGSAGYRASIIATVADYAGMGTNLNAAETGVDLTNYTAVEFWVKGNGGSNYWFQFTQPSITDGDNFGTAFTAPAAWTKVTVPIDAASLAQRGFGTASAFTKNAVAALQWQSNATGALDIQVDNVRLLSSVPITPTNTVSTPVITNTFTRTSTPVTTTPTFTPTGGTGTNKQYCFTLDYSAVPADIFKRMITLNVSVGTASSVNVTADGTPVTCTYTAGTGMVSFSLHQPRTNIVVTAVNWTSGGTGVATKATLWENKKWAYSFTFDDNYAADYTIVYPYWSARNLRGSIGVVTNWIGNGGYLNRTQLDALFNAGWGILNHSTTHPQSTISAANLATYVGAAKATLESWYPSNYKNIYFIYPYLEMGYKSALSTSGYVRAAEGVDGTNYVDTFPADLYNLYRHGMYASVDAAAANTWADQAASDARPRWNIVFTHNTVAGSGTPGTYDTNQATLESHINYVYTTYGDGGSTKNMWFAPSDEVLCYLYTRQNLNIVPCSSTPVTPSVTPTTPVPSATASVSPTNINTNTPTNTFTNTPVTPTVTPTFTPTVIVASIWRINSGGTSYTDSLGNAWAADSNYTSGTARTVTNAIAGTADAALYQTERYGSPFTYTFAVPAGSYQVTLKFAELYQTTAAGRVFNVSINGTQVLSNLDLFAEAGAAYTAVDKVINDVLAAGGVITIQVGPASVDNAQICAIQIIPQPATPTATPTTPVPTNTPITPTATPTTPVPTNTFTLTNTPITPSATPTTPVPTNTPITPSPTPTTPVPTNTPITPSPTPTTPVPTNTPITPSPTPTTPVPTNTPITPSATPTTPVPTNTPITPTATPTTPVPTSTPVTPTVTPNVSLRIMLKSADINNKSNSPHPQFQVVNTGTSTLNLNNIEVRYWLNCDCASTGSASLLSAIDWAGKMPQGTSLGSNVQITAVTAARGSQTGYLRIRFSGNITLQPNEFVEVQTRFNKSDWSAMTQSNDWSYSNSQSWLAYDRVTGYSSGALIWGQEPPLSTAVVQVANVLSYPNPATSATGATLQYTINPVSAGISAAGYEPVYVPDLSTKVYLKIFSNAGRLIWEQELDGLYYVSTGIHDVRWDGKAAGGHALSAGNYTLKVELKEPNGDSQGFSRIIVLK